MNKIKLVAIDLDGTLLNNEGEVSKGNEEAIKKAIKNGIKVVICTGRMYKSVLQFQHIFPDKTPAITYNGGMIKELNNGKTIFTSSIPKDKREYVFNTMRKYKLGINMYINDCLYGDERNQYIKKYAGHVKVNYGIIKDKDLVVGFKEKNFIKMVGIGHAELIDDFLYNEGENIERELYITRSMDHFIEISEKGINKGAALLKLAEDMDITPDEIMAIGDNLNDKEMLELVGYPVVMENCNEKLKSFGYYKTSSNIDDGVKIAIEEYLK